MGFLRTDVLFLLYRPKLRAPAQQRKSLSIRKHLNGRVPAMRAAAGSPAAQAKAK
jgi:hypothetical protein